MEGGSNMSKDTEATTVKPADEAEPLDWRNFLGDLGPEPDDDDDSIPTPLDVIAVLGFDPDEP